MQIIFESKEYKKEDEESDTEEARKKKSRKGGLPVLHPSEADTQTTDTICQHEIVERHHFPHCTHGKDHGFLGGDWLEMFDMTELAAGCSQTRSNNGPSMKVEG